MFLRAPAWSVLVKSCVQCMAAEQQRLQNYPWFDQISSCERMAPRSLLIRIYQIKSFIACSQLYFCLHCLAVFVVFLNWALDLCCTCTRLRPFAAPTRSAVIV